jgi:hypothetical protein
VATTGIYNQLLRPAETPEEINDQAQSDQISERVTQLGLLTAGSPLAEERNEGNTYNLTQGEHGALDHKAPHGDIRGVVAGASFNKRCVFSASGVVTGVTFTDAGDESLAEIVRVTFPGSDTGVMFINCTFVRSAASSTCHVLVESGSTAIFIGCTFRGRSQEAGDVIDNENTGMGAAVKVQVIGSFNYTANANLGSNITNVGVLTP